MAFSANMFIRQSEVVAFKGRKDVLSNFYPCNIFYKERWFNCSEQIYQYEKAVFHGCSKEALAQLLLLKTPYEQKSWAKKITVRTAWYAIRRETMKEILRVKLECVREYKQLLLQSKGVLAEAVPGERFWSVGLSKSEVFRVPAADWPGRNELGNIHMELRAELKALQQSLLDKAQCFSMQPNIAPAISIDTNELLCTITTTSATEAMRIADKHYIPRNTVRFVLQSKQTTQAGTASAAGSRKRKQVCVTVTQKSKEQSSTTNKVDQPITTMQPQ